MVPAAELRRFRVKVLHVGLSGSVLLSCSTPSGPLSSDSASSCSLLKHGRNTGSPDGPVWLMTSRSLSGSVAYGTGPSSATSILIRSRCSLPGSVFT